MLLALLSLPANANAIRMAAVYHDDQPHGQVESRDPSLHVVSWPFCPSYGKSCSELAWVEVGVSVDAYVARRNGPHATASELTQTSVVDMQPMARALEDFFREQGITSDAVKVGYAHGLVQSLDYHLDSETGWTEYPKYAIESLVDEQGDCDDGAIWTASLLTALGYSPFYVRWRNKDDSGGHLSTALPIGTGDLAQVERPSDSPLITWEGQDFLHVDGTGSIGGCGRGCGKLGWNGWKAKGLSLQTVVAVAGPNLDTLLPLSAWDNGNQHFPGRQTQDWREEDPDRIRERLQDWDWEARTKSRLKDLGREDPEVWLKKRQPNPVGDGTWMLLSGAMSFGLLMALALTWRARQRRLAEAERLAAERRKQQF